MDVMLWVAVALLVSMVLMLLRALAGPGIYDRMLAANAFGSKTMILIALLSYLLEEPMLLDIALVYAMINFITTIGFLKYVKVKSFARE